MLCFNKQLLSAFFYEKKVTYNQNLFSKYHNIIFPSSQLFVSFLLSNNREEQIVYAKQIIQRLCFCNYNACLFELYKNLIDLEEKNLIENDKSHIYRDHSIHSVNTYLLGLYLYFEFGVFNHQLNNFFSQNIFNDIYSQNQKDNSFLAFLESWKIFALNHDLGYPLELLVEENGCINTEHIENIELLNSVSDLIVREFSQNELLFLVSLQIIINISNKPIQKFLSYQDISTLEDLNFNLKEHIKLENIFSHNIFMYYSSAFEVDSLFFKISNKISGEVLLCYYDKSDYSKINSIDIKNKTLRKTNINNIINENCTLEYFYPKNKCDNIIPAVLSTLSPYIDDIKKAASIILSNHTISYAGVSDESSYLEFLFEIYISIVSNLKSKKIIPDKDYYKKHVNEFKDFISNKILKYTYNINYSKNITENIEELLKEIFACAEMDSIVQEFFEKSNPTSSFDLTLIYTRIASQYNELLSNHTLSSFLKFNEHKVQLEHTTSEFDVFVSRISEDYDILLKSSNLISKDISVDMVLKYHPPYSMFDHGISSCYLILETFFKANILKKEIQNRLLLKNSNINTPNFNILLNASYAVLVHNIYTPFLNALSDSPPVKHDILKNPFVYFCLFCDNMQIWDRPYRLNQGKVELEKATVPATDISIIVTGNKLCIQCITLEAEKICSNYRKDLDEYLKDGSKLIALNIFDK